ncbi:MAG TPA: NHL repeat-containing protein [Candidatus Baltobacteraceae bacterium]|nr:NHL repeat-containing protein [Candidatus Baltobacteraceae bacterium]
MMKTVARPDLLLAAAFVLLTGCSSSSAQRIVPGALSPGAMAPRLLGHSTPFTNLYVANASTVTVYAPGSGAVMRKISNVEPASLAVDSSGNLYVASETGAGRVQVYKPGATVPFRTITQNVRGPRTLAVDRSDDLYVANGYFSVGVYAPGSSTPLRNLKSFYPISIAFDVADNVYVGRSSGPYGGNASRVVVFAHDSSKTLRTIAAGISDPQSLAFDASGNLYVADTNVDLVAVYPKGATKPLRKMRTGRGPTSLAVDGSGNLYVANNVSSTVTVYALGKSKPVRTITSGISGPTALLLDASGTLYVANRRTVTVYAPGSSSPELKIRNGINEPVALALGP